MAWGWDVSSGRYREIETGRFFPRGAVLDFVQRSISASNVAAGRLAEFVDTGTVNPADFRDLFQEDIKREYIREYLLGIGGREQMTQRDWGSVGGMVADQYRYLDGFIAEIEAGNLTEAQIQMRMGMYINSAREAYERANGRVAEKMGCTEERWELGATEHCFDCIEFNAQGWQPAGAFPVPGAGATKCLTNCACHLAWRNPETGVVL